MSRAKTAKGVKTAKADRTRAWELGKAVSSRKRKQPKVAAVRVDLLFWERHRGRKPKGGRIAKNGNRKPVLGQIQKRGERSSKASGRLGAVPIRKGNQPTSEPAENAEVQAGRKKDAGGAAKPIEWLRRFERR